MDESPQHDELIRDQFTRQAVPFAEKMAARDRTNFAVLRDLTQVSPEDTVLDVACGPGLVACAFAEVAREVTGLDLTPAMLERARRLQADLGLRNIRWDLGDLYRLPYPDGSFSIVVTRYSFHHLTDPAAALREMVRVCSPGGRVCVIDMVTTPQASRAFNAMEKLRDASHLRALTQEELISLLADAGLTNVQSASYRMEWKVEQQLRASATEPEDAHRFRTIIRSDLGKDELGVAARLVGGELHYSYANLAVVGWKPDAG
jgi:ubiquinone/menaquinone biosynthesis C-methylase UbiE